MERRILVMGSGGMLGHVVYLKLKEKFGDLVKGIGRSEGPTIDLIAVDDPAVFVDQNDIVVNCIGVLNSSCDVNPVRAMKLNAVLPHELAEKCNHLIHISTDCVFAFRDDHKPISKVTRPDPTTTYGATKALGEVCYHPLALTLRQSLVGPSIDPNNIGLFNWFMKRESAVIRGYTNHLWNGVTTTFLADYIVEHIVRYQNENIREWGLRHLVTAEIQTKAQLLHAFNEVFDTGAFIDDVHDDTFETMANRALEYDLECPPFLDQLVEMRKWYDDHQELYSHGTGY